jgi:hypothetical protein
MSLQILKQTSSPFDGCEIRYKASPDGEMIITHCDSVGNIKSSDLQKLVGREVHVLINGDPYRIFIREKGTYTLQI